MSQGSNRQPDALKRLVGQEQVDAIEYVDLVGNAHILQEWISNGDHGKAEVKAIERQRQRQPRDAQMNGLPGRLQELVDQVHSKATKYIGLAGDVRSLNEWIANGDYGHAEIKAKQILKWQRQILDFQPNGFPFKLQKVVNPENGNATMYADSAGDVRSLDEWIANGDQGLAESHANQIIGRGTHFRDEQLNGLPDKLQQLVDQVYSDARDYAGRAGDMRSLDEWIANGEHAKAELKAKQIIERQRNSSTVRAL